jgi:acyl-CoA thioester hydrolase
MTNSSQSIYTYTFAVPPEAIDGNGHVNNVYYVQWMQEAAVRHYAALGGVPPMQVVGATWVVRSHQIEYLAPAFAGDEIEVRTWVVNLRRVRSLRRYEFLRRTDGRLLAKGETDWVFVEASTGRELAIPETVSRLFSLLPENP